MTYRRLYNMKFHLKRLHKVLLRGIPVAVASAVMVFNPLQSADRLASDIGTDVLGAVDAIAKLHQLSPIFTDPGRREGMSLQQRKATEIEARKQLQRVPLELLIPQIEKYSVASERQIRSFENPREFVMRLSDVAMNGIISPPTLEVPAHGPVAFKGDASQSSKIRVFRAPTPRIFAVFDSAAYHDTRVLVKWYQPSSGRILLFKQFEISSASSNYVWIDNSKGHVAGEYRVEIYRVNQSLQLLSSGNYRVET